MDNLYLAAICAVVPGLGRAKLPAALELLGGSKEVFEASAEALLATGVFSRAQVYAFCANRRKVEPKILEQFCRKYAVRLLSIYDEDYPESLKQIADSPLVLYVRGELPVSEYSLAIVGSRAASAYGIRAAEYFAMAMARQGIPIISGGAKGIDTSAHEACLQAGGRTVAVLGCGLDIAYPAENAGLFERIIRSGGAVISEYPPGVQPLAQNFPARNRIVVGLSQGVLVAEAARRSGALITANIAADEGRDVFCIPGNIFDNTSIGCHDLIRNGAKLVDSPEHILEERTNWQLQKGRHISQPSIFDFTITNTRTKEPAAKLAAAKASTDQLPDISELGTKLYGLLKSGALTLESLTEQSGADFASVSMELLELQVAGLVTQDQAQRYCRR